MEDELTSSQQKQSRAAPSPLVDERSPKRSRKSTEPADMEQIPETILIDVIADGDAMLVLKGFSTAPDEPVGLRVSSYALSMASPVFKALFATTATTRDEEPRTVLHLPSDDSDATWTLCNILHLRNDKLTPRISPELLCKLALLAHKYKCTIAIGRATTQWFDHLYHSPTLTHLDLSRLVEAAYLLSEAVFFARFSSRWVLETSILIPQIPLMSTPETQKLALLLHNQHNSAVTTLRTDLDDLVDRAARYFSREFKHYPDWAPDMSPEASASPSGKPAQYCRVDGDGGAEFLGALRDANIWPSGTWYREPSGRDNITLDQDQMHTVTIAKIVNRLKEFRAPEYNDADQCEFCDQVKVEFGKKLEVTKRSQRERLWGLCLDCYKAGGLSEGECRFEHGKEVRVQQLTPNLHLGVAVPKVLVQQGPHSQLPQFPQSQDQQVQGGLGIQGL